MAGVKGKSGGRGPGAGRKPKAVEIELSKLLDDKWPLEEREKAISIFANRAAQGDLSAFQLLLAYSYGKPTERHQHRLQG
jgi:hypothetical protein